MKIRGSSIAFACLALLAGGAWGCGGSQSAGMDSGAPMPTPANDRGEDDDGRDDDHHPGDDRPGGDGERELVESDLYRVVGDTLYVYNYTSGLHSIDVSAPASPALLDQTEDVFGPAGELYADNGEVFVLLEAASTHCQACDGQPVAYQGSELVGVIDHGSQLEVASRTCLPGQVIASRMLGDILYAVTYDGYLRKSYAVSIDVSNVAKPTHVDLIELPGNSHEIHMNDTALFVAQPVETTDEYNWTSHDTRITYIDITNPSGLLQQRGSIQVEGAPQGRFHMDATADTFRIVTFDEYYRASVLHVIDISSPDTLAVVGSLEQIAPGEELKATRFVDDRAYIVTFRQSDPLWVIDLSQPSQPQTIGELWVPGWSDYIFPRDGGRLLTVGRGAGGGVSASLFDVSDPHYPQQLSTAEVGYWDSNSEALADFRGVRVIEAGELGDHPNPIVALPVSTWDYDTNYQQVCSNWLHFIELQGNNLTLQGSIAVEGAIRRAVPIGSQVFAISDLNIQSIDVTSLAQPTNSAVLSVGNAELASNPCEMGEEQWGGGWGGGMPPGDDVMMVDDMPYGACHVTAGAARFGAGQAFIALLALGALSVALRRRSAGEARVPPQPKQ